MNFANAVEQAYDEYHDDYRAACDLPEHELIKLALLYFSINERDLGEITCEIDFSTALHQLGKGDEADAGLHIKAAVISAAMPMIEREWAIVAERDLPGPTTAEELNDDRNRDNREWIARTGEHAF